MDNNNIDDEFFESLKAGCRICQKQFFNMHFNEVVKRAFIVAKDIDESHDIAMYAMTEALTRIEEMRSFNGMIGFMFTIARNKSIDYYRRRKKYVHGDVREDDLIEEPAYAKTERIDVLEFAYHYIEKLPKKQKKIMKLIFVDGLRNKDVCKEYKYDDSTVSNTKKVAVDKLKKVLKQKQLT